MSFAPRLDEHANPTETAFIGIKLCREQKWKRAYDFLSVAAARATESQLPDTFYSYLGLATARVKKRKGSAVRYCERAVQEHPLVVENWVNLIELRLMMGDAGRAWRATQRGLALNPDDARIERYLKEELVRQPVPIPFLARGNRLNVLLGRMRHQRREELEYSA